MASSSTVRFGIHDFLNAQPLLVPLQRNAKSRGVEIVLDAPSALADRLEAGELDLAMIPAVEYLRQADAYSLLPDLCIASRGVVETVLLAARKPLERVKTLALDNRSRTSVALLKILFADRLGADVSYVPSAPDPQEMLNEHDAALIIGDQALNVKKPGGDGTVYDLSEEWFQRTGRIFVHAVVACRPERAIGGDVIEWLLEAKRKGREELEPIVTAYCRRTGLEPKRCETYLKSRILYDLGEPEIEALTHFQNLCHEKDLIPEKFPLRFAES